MWIVSVPPSAAYAAEGADDAVGLDAPVLGRAVAEAGENVVDAASDALVVLGEGLQSGYGFERELLLRHGSLLIRRRAVESGFVGGA